MFRIRDIGGIFSVANFGSNPPSIIIESGNGFDNVHFSDFSGLARISDLAVRGSG